MENLSSAEFSFSKNLESELVNDDDLTAIITNQEVETNLLRVKGSIAMEYAMALAKDRKFTEALQMLTDTQ